MFEELDVRVRLGMVELVHDYHIELRRIHLLDVAVDGGPQSIAYNAAVPGWLTVLTIVATSDAIATCPRSHDGIE